MKLCKLKLKNLNSFREEIALDFEKSPLDGASLIAITGPTGAGKTTLLDAICVALYGKTPRLSGTGSQHPRHLISHGETEGFAEVHFMANGIRYIAAWSIKRRGSASVRLSYAADDKLISDKLSPQGKSLGASERTVSEEVESILGLDFAAFRRSIMLAQGEFAAFLKASKEDRRTILEATAGIDIYEILKDTLHKKVSEVAAANADALDKLNKIPEASHEQLTEAETERNRLQTRADALDAESKEVQSEKTRETIRKEGFEKLQSSEERQSELSDQQPAIDVLRVELDNANRAERLGPEKQAFDAAKLDFEKAKKAFDDATTEETAAKDQVKADQADFDKKEKAYQAASTEHKQKTDIYTNAKLDVSRAVDQFAEADRRTPVLVDLDNRIDALETQLTSGESEKARLQKQINKAQTFLDKNPLPSDRQHRLNRADVLLTQLNSQQGQLETASATQAQHNKKVVSLKREIDKLSNTFQKQRSEKSDAKSALDNASAELNKLLATGTDEEWNARKRQLSKAQPIAQEYETSKDGLADAEDRLSELKETRAELDAELEEIEDELMRQRGVCQHAEGVVQSCEESLKSALLANPINQLRQHLHAGEPCLVCGATEHPSADAVEPESEDLLQNAENALAAAKTDEKAADVQMQALNTQQAKVQQNKDNTSSDIKKSAAEIKTLQNELASLLTQWQEIYLNDDVSSGWVAAQIKTADTAIADLGKAEQAHTKASHAYQIATQQLGNCENDIKREKKSLEQAEKDLQDASNAVADLQADIASTEKRFWEFLPDAFHGVKPDTALDQFSDKIKEVATRQDKLDTAETDLKLLNAKIETDQNSLKTLRQNHRDMQTEIGKYRREGEAFLDTVRRKTGGLETETAINAAIKNLDAELQAKKDKRDAADQRLQQSQNLLTEKRTTHENCKRRHKECERKFETAHKTYFDKLSDAGFDSPEAHDNAFLDDARLQEITGRIGTYENEKQQLTLEITRLQTRFEEKPFDPKALEKIRTQAKEIEERLQAAQQEVGAQRKEIRNLKDALQKREALSDKMRAAEQELERWKRLQGTIPANTLRDFALEIMFKQMGSLANEQLRYLTSDRYQLKVETIGDLSVIDRWNANEERPVETLSGGESFLTSLALALALADLSRGRAQLNSLFLDEGFGTLDTETLDTAIAALEGIRMQGRSIFVISHVQELMRRLPVKINVKKEGNGSSSVQVQG